jgi:hypothetical protein
MELSAVSDNVKDTDITYANPVYCQWIVLITS